MKILNVGITKQRGGKILSFIVNNEMKRRKCNEIETRLPCILNWEFSAKRCKREKVIGNIYLIG